MQGATAAGATGAMVALGLRKAKADNEANPWAYDVSRYLTTDPSLLQYSESSSFQSLYSNLRALTIDADETLWLAGGKKVIQASRQGETLSEWSTLGEVRSLAVSGDEIYIAFKEQAGVYDRKGNQLALWDSPGNKAYFTGIAAGKNSVFVADAGNRVIHRYDKSGRLLNRIGAKEPERNIPGFIVPSPFFSVALGADGLLRATNPGRHRVELYTAEGDLEFAWGNAGAAIENFCGCCNPIDLALLKDGRTITIEKGIPRVKVYSARGEFECVVAGPESFSENAEVCGPNDCTLGGMDGVVDKSGSVFLLDFVTGKVRVMKRKEEST